MPRGVHTSEAATRRRLPSPAMLVAIAALIAALGGSAYAVSKIDSGDIARDAVRSKHLKDGQLKPGDADLLGFDRAMAERSRPGTAGIGGLPDDPSVAVRAKPGDVLFFHGRVDIRRDAGTGRCNVNFVLESPGEPGGSSRFAAADGANFETVWADPDADDVFAGTSSSFRAEGRQLPVLRGGRYRLGVSYDAGNAGTDCTYRERALWLGIWR